MTTEQSHVHPLESEARRGSTHEKLQEELSQLNLNEESSGSDDEISSGMSRVAKEEASTPLDDGASEQDRLRQEIARLKDENKRLIKMVQERDHWQAKAREYKKKCHILKAIVKKTQAEIEQWDGATTDMQEVNNKDQQPEGPSPDFKTVRAEEPQTDRDLRRSQFYASVWYHFFYETARDLLRDLIGETKGDTHPKVRQNSRPGGRLLS